MPETLLSASNILLYGREVTDLTIVRPPQPPGPVVSGPEQEPDDPQPLQPPPEPPRKGLNRFLEMQLEDPEAKLARIYGFSYEGHYYDLAKPTIFLVRGPGSDPEARRPAPALPDARADRAPADVDRTGVARTDSSFSDDIRVWSYDKSDFSIRLDIETGPFEDILLEAALRPGVDTSYSGANTRISGANTRVSGANARIAGANARIRSDLGD